MRSFGEAILKKLIAEIAAVPPAELAQTNHRRLN